MLRVAERAGGILLDRLAMRAHPVPVGNAADQGGDGAAARRMADRADAVAVDPVLPFGIGEQVVEHARYLSRPLVAVTRVRH